MQLVREINDSVTITMPRDTEHYFNEFKEEDREYFIVLGLDSQKKVLFREIISIGTLNYSIVHPREVFKRAIMSSANNIIVAHNHPSGSRIPSEEDIRLTKALYESGKILGIEVLDSIIITKDGICPFLDDVKSTIE